VPLIARSRDPASGTPINGRRSNRLSRDPVVTPGYAVSASCMAPVCSGVQPGTASNSSVNSGNAAEVLADPGLRPA